MLIQSNTNLEYLYQNQNNIEILKSKTGKLTLKQAGLFIHSKYNPEKEAIKVADIPNPDNTSIIFVLGLGLGYHINAIIDKMQKREYTLFIFEKNINVVKLCMENSLLDFIKKDNVFLFAGDSAFESFSEHCKTLYINQIKGYRVIKLNPAVKLNKQYYQGLIDNISSELSVLFMNAFTRFELQRLWIENIIENSPAIINNLLRIKKKPECPAAVVAAGPSLKYSIETLKKIQKNVWIFCVDTALGALSETGIIPDFVISLDSQIHNLKDFYSSNKHKSKLSVILGASCYPGIQNMAGDVFFFTGLKDDLLIKEIEKITHSQILKIDVDVSVTSAAINLALKAGFEHIFLFGLDMAYINDMTHIQSSPIYNNFLYSSNKFSTLPLKFINIIRQRNTYKKGKLKIDFNTKAFKKNLEILIQNSKANFYFSGSGQNIAGAKHLPYNVDISFYKIHEKSGAIFIKEKARNENLYGFFSDFLKELKIFYEKLYNFKENVDEILNFKSALQKKYPFIKNYFLQDDLYFERSESGDKMKKNTLYVLSLLNRVKKVEKSVLRALHKLKSSHNANVN